MPVTGEDLRAAVDPVLNGQPVPETQRPSAGCNIKWKPDYEHANAFGHDAPLLALCWTGEADTACLAEGLGQTLRLGFAHHIQRLMVTGLFAMAFGVDPHEVHRRYLAVYVGAAEWVELSNVLGMSQFADGGR